MRTPWQEQYLQRFYSPECGWVDGTTEFHDLCAATIPHGGRILEIGAGPSNETSRFMAELGELHGIDPDPAAMQNDALASADIMRGDRFPYDSASFDACVSSWVVEHIAAPHLHLREIRRVLKPGAPYIFRTPNIKHFVYRVAARTPHTLHLALANWLRNLPSDAHDPYRTTYAMNSSGRIRTLAVTAGFSVEVLRLIEKEPSYGMASRVLFLLFMAYERTVNATDRLADIRATILCVLRADGLTSKGLVQGSSTAASKRGDPANGLSI
jgi:SAM-dependent methyltransferase